MTQSPAQPLSQPEIAAADERTSRHLRMLRDVADMAMDFARQVHRDANPVAPPPVSPVPPAPAAYPPALVFARIARCLRQTLALETRVANDHRTRTADAAAADDRARIAARNQALRRIRHGIHAALSADRAAPRAPNLAMRLEERLIDLETDDDLAANRPLAEIVARICRSLRIAPPSLADIAAATPPPDPAVPQPTPQPAPIPDLLVPVPS